MTSYIADQSRVSHSPKMYDLSQYDSLSVLDGVSLLARAPNSKIAVMDADTTVTLGEHARATSIDTAFLGAGDRINIELGNGSSAISARGYAFNLEGMHNSITNFGQITSGSGSDYGAAGRGAIFGGGGTFISNFGKIGNLKAGHYVGIDLKDGGNTINNLGADSSIAGGSSAIRMAGGNNTITNDGSIKADHCAAIHITESGSFEANTIVNSGTIGLVRNGHAILSEGSARDTVVNMAGHVDAGTIKGNISLGAGMDQVRNYGVIDGTTQMGAENDKFVNNGDLRGDVHLDEGHDFFDGSRGTHCGRVFGGKDNDTVFGSAGNDFIVGGEGRDVLYGNAGRDTFVFDAKPTSATIDELRDFKAADDMIWLDHMVFNFQAGRISADQFRIGSKALDETDRVIYDQAKGLVSIDLDGSGTAHDAVVFAKVPPWLALTAGNFLFV